jgi:hypothetical protein
MFKSFNRYARFKPPPYVLPRVAGEETGGGLNVLNLYFYSLSSSQSSMYGKLCAQKSWLQ